jgi:SnoaL-like protein
MTTDVTLPPAVDTYLRAPKEELGSIAGDLFTGDAVVHDDGRTHEGVEAIRDWADRVAAAFTYTRTVTDATFRRDAAIVRVRVDGDFPGSPVTLHHHFSLDDGKISAMTICA